jgi:hypothetical protein
MPVGTSSARVLASSWWRCRCGSGEAGSKFSDELEGFRVGGSPESHAAGKEPSDPLGAEFAMIWSRRNGFIELGFRLPGAVGPPSSESDSEHWPGFGPGAQLQVPPADHLQRRLVAAGSLSVQRLGPGSRLLTVTQWQWQLDSEFEPRKPRDSEAQVHWHRDRQ